MSDIGGPPDERTVAREAMERYATEGDEHAFVELYGIIAPRLWAYLCRRLPTPCAEDVMQQTFLRMHQARGTFKTGSDVFPWMYSIAYHLAIDCVRRGGRQWRLIEEYTPPVQIPVAPDAHLEAQQAGDRIRAAIEKMPESQRTVLELVRGEGLTHREVAEMLNTSVSSVKSAVHRALKAIREALGYEDEEAAT